MLGSHAPKVCFWERVWAQSALLFSLLDAGETGKEKAFWRRQRRTLKIYQSQLKKSEFEFIF
jgi:hypothetical protein